MKEGKEKIVEKWSKHFLNRFFKKGTSIMNAGEIGQEFFIILHGKVSVYLQKIIEPLLTFKEFCLFIKKHLVLINYVDDKPLDPSLVELISFLNNEGNIIEDLFEGTE